MKSAKDIAALLIAKPKHPMQGVEDGDLPGDDDEGDDRSEDLSLVAGDILDAIKGEDSDELAEALQAFIASARRSEDL